MRRLLLVLGLSVAAGLPAVADEPAKPQPREGVKGLGVEVKGIKDDQGTKIRDALKGLDPVARAMVTPGKEAFKVALAFKNGKDNVRWSDIGKAISGAAGEGAKIEIGTPEARLAGKVSVHAEGVEDKDGEAIAAALAKHKSIEKAEYKGKGQFDVAIKAKNTVTLADLWKAIVSTADAKVMRPYKLTDLVFNTPIPPPSKKAG